MNKLLLLIVFALLLSSCSTMSNVTRPEHRHTMEFNQNYLVVYRVIVQGLERQGVQPGFIRATIFPDTKTARVFIAASEPILVGSVHDIRAVGDNKTIVDYYPGICLLCTEEYAQKHMARLRSWVEEIELKEKGIKTGKI